jgi:hypothetical protein
VSGGHLEGQFEGQNGTSDHPERLRENRRAPRRTIAQLDVVTSWYQAIYQVTPDSIIVTSLPAAYNFTFVAGVLLAACLGARLHLSSGSHRVLDDAARLASSADRLIVLANPVILDQAAPTAALPASGYELDFRVGGHERFSGLAPDGAPYSYDALYYDIVPGHRIVYSYEMYAARDRMSVSLATVEISPDQDGTRLTYTEQHAFPDGTGKPGAREEGTAWMLDNLGRYLASHAGS